MSGKFLTVAALACVVGLASASPAAAATTEASLSNSSLLTAQTTTFADGSAMTSTVLPDSTAPLALASDGYPCADVGYRAVVKWYTALVGWVSWTWTMHFGAHVCHDKVQSNTYFYATVDSELPTWSYCGVVARSRGPALPYTSEHAYMEGCFSLYDRIVVQKFPWARITIGGNGGLWASSTGVN